jgi:glycosyltransferase involved in cell wall biosynthesis
VVVQSAMPSYRDDFVLEVLRQRPATRFYCGDSQFDPTVVLSPRIAEICGRLTNHYFLARRLLWQSGAVRAAVAPPAAVVEFNPRILSVWVALVLRRILRRRSVLWGHAWPRSGPSSRSVPVRRVMVCLADAVLMYTEQDRRELAPTVPRPVFVAPNAVTSRAATRLVPGRALDVVQIGRLVEPKRPLLTLEAWLGVASRLPPQARMIFVGTGPEERRIRERLAGSDLAERVLLLGHVSAPDELESVFADALVSVSAGYAGLAVTHSFAYGVPAAIADDEPHAPEIAVASPSNSRRFCAGDARDLGRVLLEMYAEREDWLARRRAISEQTLETYSTEAMARGVLEAVDSARAARRHKR